MQGQYARVLSHLAVMMFDRGLGSLEGAHRAGAHLSDVRQHLLRMGC